MKKITYLLLFLLFSFTGLAQTAQIGSGTGTITGTAAMPVSNYVYNYSQQIVTAAEITGGGGPATGNIVTIRYKPTIVGTATVWNNWTVYVGNTTKTSFTSTTDWVPLGSMTQVFSGTITPVANNWFDITFTAPFPYTGGNLVIAVDENTLGWSTAPTFSSYTSTANAGIYYRNDTTNPAPATPPAATGRVSAVPQLQIVFPSSTPPSCAITHVPTDLATGVARNPTLSWADGGGGPTSYDVYFGTATNPALVGNQVGTTYTPALLAANTDYFWKVVPKNANGVATGCVERKFTTGTAISYCESTYTSGPGTTDGITNVTLGSLNNTSTQNNVAPYYTFYNSVTIPNIAQATSANVSITFGSDGNQYSAVWIDFNQNGTFEASEGFLSPGNAGASGTSIINVTIPAGAVLGNTRMRVRGGNDSALTTAQACGASSSAYGETEDYIVNITAPPACNVPSALSVTSVTASSATISWSAAVPAPGVGYEYAVTTSATPPASGTPIAGTTTSVILSAQTTYYLHVRSECTAGTEYSAWVTSASFTTLCNVITTLPHIEGFDTVGVVPTCWTRALVTGTTNWLPAASNDGVPSPRTGAAFASKTWSGNDNALFISPVYNLTANPTSVARVNVWIYRNATNGLSTDRTAFYVNTTNNLTGATQLLDIPLRTNQAPVVATAGWYNYIAEIPLSYNTGGNFYVIASGTTTSSFSSYSVGFDDYTLEFAPTDTPDYVNLQFPASATILAGNTTTVYGQVYEAGLTDVVPNITGQAPGIEAWVGISAIGAPVGTNPNTYTTWIPATWNSGNVSNNDEYQAAIGATLLPGVYRYVTRFRLNGGPFRYGGTDGTNGNFWDGTTYFSGVLTVNANPTQCATLVSPADAVTGVFAGTVALSWTAPVSGPTPTGYKVYFGTTPNPTTLLTTVTTLTHNVSAPGYLTQYYWRVVPTSTIGGDATGCSEFSFTTQANPMAGYCTSAPTSNDGSGITNVTLGATNFPTGDVFYFYHGNTPVALNAGTLSNCQITFNTSIYDYDTHIWIDFNNNQVFDATEKVFTGVSSTTSPNTLNSSFTIPASVLTGQYKMRIATADTGNPVPGDPCYSGTYGVTLDFTVNVTGLCSSTATWDGTMWTGTPSSTAVLVFNGNYTHASATVLEGCSCTINGTSVVTFNNGTLNLQNHLTTAAGTSLVMESGASLVQVNTTVANSVLGTFTAKRNSANMVRLDYTGWSSPVVGQNALAFSPATLTNRFYEYDPTANVYSGISAASTNFTAGKGLLVRAPNNWVAAPGTPVAYPGSFTGVPNNGDLTSAVGVGFNLLGNPYASPISANLLLTNTNNATLGMGTLYFWTHTLAASGGTYATSNYATHNGAGGLAASAGGAVPDGIIQVGQGFLVDAITAGSAQFNNSMRLTTSNGQFFKTTGEVNQPITIEKHRMWLGLTSPGFRHNQILVGYIGGATNGVDTGLDAILFEQVNSVLYTPINSSKYVIQSRALPFTATDVVPLGLFAKTAGQYTISMDNFDGVFSGQDVFLKDNLLNITHDIKGAPYTFASDAGEFGSRFEIVYASPLVVETPTFNENSVVVYNNESGININSGNTLIDTVKVFDVRGRLLITKTKVNANTITIENATSERQVLIIQITSTDNVTISKKVIN